MIAPAVRDTWLRDDAGHPLGAGMPTGRVLRADGQSHRAWWMTVLRADPCAYCGRAAGERRFDDGRIRPDGTVDHIDPQSGRRRGVGGLHDWVNYVGACASCNRAKASDPLLVFLIRRAGARIAPAPTCPPGRRPRARSGHAAACVTFPPRGGTRVTHVG